ncbi:IS1595 family transposase [Nemorincola caseinilytica]|uniref:IS1595 family transposase n=1 Tax=Nemorincola caseinilytica TaxID=2054315 RepID=A0ABP8NC37_9BACT
MQFKFKTIQEFNDFFKDERTCYEFMEQQRWGNVAVCPHCGTAKAPYKVKPRGMFKDIPSYRCSERTCDLPFTVRTGSIFEGSKVELRKWLQACYEIMTSKKGISSHELAIRIGVSQKTGWLMNHKIRTLLQETAPQLLGGNGSPVQADETYVGGKNKNRHKDKKVEGSQGRSAADKTPVVGLIEKGGKVMTFVTENTNADTLNTIINDNVAEGATIVTDAYRSYSTIGNAYEHITVKHEEGGYITERNGNKFHTQNIENFWSQLKRGYVGIYHYMSPQHLHRYCNEFATRYNLREQNNLDRVLFVINNTNTERITYRTLTPNIPKFLKRPKE